ncbi:MAG: TonB-dependent receptor [Betaproteobacteria bacterium HGW-Betaproteobacteria-7]|jgi:iron complex outermembrane receptor protein|nr:MAG: TonB-dependent receptor [Betaproteobacteria bacterium HGW-Betaproteobacteria-7]
MKPLVTRFFLLPVVFFSFSATADEELFFSDLPVVASVSRLPQRLADAPSSVTVIDRATIKASGARALSDVFRLVPGFQTFAKSDAAPRVNYHGVSDDNEFAPRVQVLVDGRSLYSPLFRGGVNWTLVPVALEDIERIEVVRGSNTTSYGANAFLGVINIITVDPALVRGFSVGGNYGNQGVRDYTLRTGGGLGESGHFRLTVQNMRDDGLDDNFDWEDRNANRLFDLRVNLQLSARDALDIQVGRAEGVQLRGSYDSVRIPVVIDGETQRRLLGVEDPEDPFRDFDQSSTWIQAHWLRTLSDTADLSVRYTHSVDRASDAFIFAPLPAAYNDINEVGDVGRRHEIEAIHSFLPASGTRLIWGGSVRRDSIRSATLLRDLGTVNRDVRRVFANGEWKPNALFTGNLGWSYEYDSLAGSHPAGRVSFSLHVTPQNTIRMGYARAWRTGSTIDYRANYRVTPTVVVAQGNPNLPAERLDSWELAYLGDWRDWRMSLDTRLFREKLTDRYLDKVNATDDAPDSIYALQNLLIQGFEYQWKWQPFESSRIAFGQAFVNTDSSLTSLGQVLATPLPVLGDSSNFYRNQADYVLLAEKAAPRRSSSLLFMQRLPYGLEFSLAHYRVSAIKWTRNTDVNKYHRTDVRLGYPFVLGGQRGELGYTVQSLDGAHFEQREGQRGREVDRRQWISLRLDF